MLLIVVEQIETDTHPQKESLTSSRTNTHTHSVCGLAEATADAVHEYFSQTPWQSFHFHGPNVSS